MERYTKYLLGVLIPISCMSMYSMDLEEPGKVTQPAFKLTAFPADVLGVILCQLSCIVGTPELHNMKDLAVIVKYVKKIALSNKYLFQVLNNRTVTCMVIQALAQRFKLTLLEAAALLNTRGATQFLEDYTVDSGEYDLFKQVQRVRELIVQATAEVQQQGLLSSMSDSPPAPLSADPFYCQTTQGLLLAINTYNYSATLYTPWGQIHVLHGNKGTEQGSAMVTQKCIQCLGATFEGFERKGAADGECYLVHFNNLKCSLEKITVEQANAFKGHQVFIHGGHYGLSLYRINQVDSTPVPCYEKLERPNYRDYKFVNKLWNSMVCRYLKEHPEMRQLYKQDTESTYCQKTWATRQLEWAQKLQKLKRSCVVCQKEGSLVCCESCNQAYYCSKECQLANWPVHTVACALMPQQVSTINDIPRLCAWWAACLAAQPLFEGQGSLMDRCKVLHLEEWNDCRLCSIMSNNSREILKGAAWYITNFGSGNYQLYTPSGMCIPHGITLGLYGASHENMCTIAQLEQAYQNIIGLVKNGWAKARLKDYQAIMFPESEEEYCLFIKKQFLKEEDVLIRCLACRLGLDGKVAVNSEWLKPEGGYESTDMLYIWVKKQALKKFLQVFDITAQEGL